MDKTVFNSGLNEEEFIIEAQVRLYGTDYLLVSGDGDEEEAPAMILKDISDPASEEAVYVEVTDDDEIAAVTPLFEEELEDTLLSR